MMTVSLPKNIRLVTPEQAFASSALETTDGVYMEAEEKRSLPACTSDRTENAAASDRASESLIARYFGDVRRHALFSRAEEQRVWAQIERARCRSRRALATSPVALETLSHLAHQVASQACPLEEVLQEEASAEELRARWQAGIARLGTLQQSLHELQGERRSLPSSRQRQCQRRQDRRHLWQQWLATWESMRLSPYVYTCLQQALEHALEVSAVQAPLQAAQVAWSRAQRQLARATERMLQGNLRLVIHVARRYHDRGLPLLDLIQEGNIGLLRAVDKFDPQRGVKFATYAHWWIRQAITRALMQQHSTIRLPAYLAERKHKLRLVIEQLWQVHGREPQIQELATALGWTPEAVLELQMAGQPMIPLDAPVPHSNRRLAEVIEDTGLLPPEEQCVAEQLQERLEACLSTLTTREAFVLRLRYGWDTDHPHTLQEIATALELSRERVRQLERGALEKLRTTQCHSALADFVGST